MLGRPRTRSLETLGDTKAGQGPSGVQKVLHARSDYQSTGKAKSRESLIGLVTLMSGDTTTTTGSRAEGLDILYAYTFGCKGSRKGGDVLCSQGNK